MQPTPLDRDSPREDRRAPSESPTPRPGSWPGCPRTVRQSAVREALLGCAPGKPPGHLVLGPVQRRGEPVGVGQLIANVCGQGVVGVGGHGHG